MRWPFQNQTGPIAVDIGTACLRAVQMNPIGSSRPFRHWINQSLPQTDKESQAAAGEEPLPGLAHAKLTGLKPFAGRQITTALAPPDIDLCTLSVPDKLLTQPVDKLIRAIRQEVARHIRMPLDNAELDAWQLPKPQGNGPNLMVVAAPRATIQKLLQWVESHGCTCARIDAAPLAVMRGCARMMEGIAEDTLWGVLDVGFRASRFYLGIGQIPIYVRGMRACGDLMTRRIVNELEVDVPMAERYKRHFGIHAETSGYRPVVGGRGPAGDKRMASILLGTLTPIVRGIARDIEKSFRYAMDLYPGLPVRELVLVGGGSALDGLPELLHDLLGIPVRRACAERLQAEGANHPALSEKVILQMATCLGLSLAEVDA